MSWNPIYDIIQAITALVNALEGLSAELRALRYEELDKLVGVLKKPTESVKETLKHQKESENGVPSSTVGY